MGVRRRTASVDLILERISQSSGAVSTVDLINALTPIINKTTVYRTLERMEDSGMVHSFVDFNGLRWYAMCQGCTDERHVDVHPHFQCTECGRVECLEMEINVPSLDQKKVTKTQFLMSGKCEKCA